MIAWTSAYVIAAMAIQLGWAATPIGAKVIVLVSEAEVAADRAAASPQPATTRGSMLPPAPNVTPNPNAPRIDVLAPEIVGRPLVAPFPINLRFIPAASREIDPATLKVFYGRMGLDITARILAATRVTREGLDVPSVRVPKGSHRLLLEIRDDAGNVGRSELKFEVSE